METSIKITEEDKRRLDRLQGVLAIRRGKRMSQQEMVGKLLDLGENGKDNLVADAEKPMSERAIRRLLGLAVRTGVRTREKDVDRIVVEEIR